MTTATGSAVAHRALPPIGITPASASADRVQPVVRAGWLLPVVLLLFGLLLPSSRGGVISTPLVVLHALSMVVIVAVDWAMRQRTVPVGRTWNSTAILVIVTGATFLAPFPDLAVGGLIPYVALAALLWASVRGYHAAESVRRVFVALNVIALAAGILVVGGSEPVRDLLVRGYSIAYPELVANMTLWRKPVFTFGSHSVAAVCYYLIFYLNLETYRAEGRRLHLLLAIANVLLGVFLTSMTAGVLMAAAMAQLLWAGRGNRIVPIVALAVLAGIGLYALNRMEQEIALAEGVRLAFTVEDGGLRSRYAVGGALVGNVQYIMENPLRPIGLAFSPTLFYGDSGPVEYVLRGSVVLLLLVYGGLYAFLRANLAERRHVYHLFGLILLAEIGFTILAFGRFVYLLLFAVIYLNNFGRAPAPVPPTRPG